MTAEPDILVLQKTLYDSANPTRRWLHRSRRDWVTAQIAAHAAHGGTALEVGPGSGVYLPHLLAHFAEVTAIDIAPEFLDNARTIAAGNPRLVCRTEDITRPGAEAGPYDLILCSEVIEHLADSRTALSAIARLLKPGGTLILTTPHRWSTLETVAWLALKPGFIQIVRLIYGEAVFEMGHINLLSRGALEGQLADAGLVPRRRQAMGLYLPLVAEFLGSAGLALAQWGERRLRGGPLEQLLWTQAYVCGRAP